MTNHSLIAASGKTHAKIGFVALAVSAIFVAMVSASGATKSDATRVAAPVVKASTLMKVANTDRGLVR